MDEKRPIEWIVRDRMPGDTDEARTRRIAVLRVIHAAENVENRLDALGAALGAYTHAFAEDPQGDEAKAHAWRAWMEAEAVAKNLESLVPEIRKSHRKLVEMAGLKPEEHGL